MTAVAELIGALIASGMEPADAAVLVARAGAEMSVGTKSKAALRTQRWREKKASQNVTERHTETPSPTVTERHQPSPCDVSANPPLTYFLPVLKEELSKEGSKKVRARKSPASPIPDDFQPTEAHYEAAERLGRQRSFADEKCVDLRIWAQSNGTVKADWSATLHGFIRRDAKSGKPDKSVHTAVDNLLEKMRLLNEPAPIERTLLSPEGQGAIRRISSG